MISDLRHQGITSGYKNGCRDFCKCLTNEWKFHTRFAHWLTMNPVINNRMAYACLANTNICWNIYSYETRTLYHGIITSTVTRDAYSASPSVKFLCGNLHRPHTAPGNICWHIKEQLSFWNTFVLKYNQLADFIPLLFIPLYFLLLSFPCSVYFKAAFFLWRISWLSKSSPGSQQHSMFSTKAIKGFVFHFIFIFFCLYFLLFLYGSFFGSRMFCRIEN